MAVPRPRDALLEFLTAATDFAERRGVPVEIWRTDAPSLESATTYHPMVDWRVTLQFRDCLGWYSATLAAFAPERHEGMDAYMGRAAKAMARACAEAHHARIDQYRRGGRTDLHIEAGHRHGPLPREVAAMAAALT